MSMYKVFIFVITFGHGGQKRFENPPLVIAKRYMQFVPKKHIIMIKKITADALKSDFNYLEDENEVFTMKYQNLFSSKAETNINNEKFQIIPENIWQYSFKLIKDGQDIGTIKFNWKGHAIIELSSDVSCSLKYKGILDTRFELKNDKEELLLTAKLKNNWDLRKYEFHLDVTEQTEKLDEYIPLIILTGYALNINVNHYMNM